MNKHNELQLYLASGSPPARTADPLGYRFEVLKLDVPELRNDGEKPQDYVCRLARDKAMAGVAARPRRCRCWAPTP
jgi:septum formation protein